MGDLMQDDDASSFATVLNRAIRYRGLTLESIRRRLDAHGVTVSAATLSYWQNGRSQPTRAHSQRILTALEEVLQLSEGELTSMAPVNPIRRRRTPATSQEDLPEPVEELLDRAGQSNRLLRRISTHVVLTIAPDRSESSEVVRQVVQCLQAGTDRFPVVVEMDEGSDQEVHGLANCTPGHTIEVPERGLKFTEMHLSRPLRHGEFMMFEFLTTIGPGGEPSTAFGIASGKLSELVIEIQFPLHDLPRRVVSYIRTLEQDLGLDSPDLVELPVAEGSAQLVKVDVQPAIHMVSWEW